jgi:hypothetical protein
MVVSNRGASFASLRRTVSTSFPSARAVISPSTPPRENASARSPLWTDGDFWSRINYVHRNPEEHGYVDDVALYPWSSYSLLLETWTDEVPRAGLASFPAPRKLPNDDF